MNPCMDLNLPFGRQTKGADKQTSEFFLKIPSIALIDDDPIFNNLMDLTAKRAGIDLTSFQSLNLKERARDWTFDMAIIDYQLTDLSGIDLADQIYLKVGKVPVLLISQTNRQMKNHDMPPIVKGFSHKSKGFTRILEDALTLYSLDI